MIFDELIHNQAHRNIELCIQEYLKSIQSIENLYSFEKNNSGNDIIKKIIERAKLQIYKSGDILLDIGDYQDDIIIMLQGSCTSYIKIDEKEEENLFSLQTQIEKYKQKQQIYSDSRKISTKKNYQEHKQNIYIPNEFFFANYSDNPVQQKDEYQHYIQHVKLCLYYKKYKEAISVQLLQTCLCGQEYQSYNKLKFISRLKVEQKFHSSSIINYDSNVISENLYIVDSDESSFLFLQRDQFDKIFQFSQPFYSEIKYAFLNYFQSIKLTKDFQEFIQVLPRYCRYKQLVQANILYNKRDKLANIFIIHCGSVSINYKQTNSNEPIQIIQLFEGQILGLQSYNNETQQQRYTANCQSEELEYFQLPISILEKKMNQKLKLQLKSGCHAFNSYLVSELVKIRQTKKPDNQLGTYNQLTDAFQNTNNVLKPESSNINNLLTGNFDASSKLEFSKNDMPSFQILKTSPTNTQNFISTSNSFCIKTFKYSKNVKHVQSSRIPLQINQYNVGAQDHSSVLSPIPNKSAIVLSKSLDQNPTPINQTLHQQKIQSQNILVRRILYNYLDDDDKKIKPVSKSLEQTESNMGGLQNLCIKKLVLLNKRPIKSDHHQKIQKTPEINQPHVENSPGTFKINVFSKDEHGKNSLDSSFQFYSTPLHNPDIKSRISLQKGGYNNSPKELISPKFHTTLNYSKFSQAYFKNICNIKEDKLLINPSVHFSTINDEENIIEEIEDIHLPKINVYNLKNKLQNLV